MTKIIRAKIKHMKIIKSEAGKRIKKNISKEPASSKIEPSSFSPDLLD